jgi:hypothetical protein
MSLLPATVVNALAENIHSKIETRQQIGKRKKKNQETSLVDVLFVVI